MFLSYLVAKYNLCVTFMMLRILATYVHMLMFCWLYFGLLMTLIT